MLLSDVFFSNLSKGYAQWLFGDVLNERWSTERAALIKRLARAWEQEAWLEPERFQSETIHRFWWVFQAAGLIIWKSESKSHKYPIFSVFPCSILELAIGKVALRGQSRHVPVTAEVWAAAKEQGQRRVRQETRKKNRSVNFEGIWKVVFE